MVDGRKIEVGLGNVQKTLLLPLWGRAVETKKDKPLLVDRKAAEIVSLLDFDFAGMGRNLPELTKAAWVFRCLRADAVIKAFVDRYPTASIVNLGCGLDTTFSRVDNGTIKWYDLDLPEVLDLRGKLIARGARERALACSLFDYDGWVGQIDASGGVFLLSLGVLYYFDEGRVRAFLQSMVEVFPGAEMFFDVASPLGLKASNRFVLRSSGMDAGSSLKWACRSASRIASWDRRIEVVRVYPFFRGAGAQLRRRVPAFIFDFLKMQSLVHLRLAK